MDEISQIESNDNNNNKEKENYYQEAKRSKNIE